MKTMIEKEVVLKGDVNITGTLTVPDKSSEKFPAVLLIAGSGPLDRDGNGPKGKFQLNLYKELADFISSLGFVTFRYDKRGTGKSEGNWHETGMWDLVEDAERAVDFLKNEACVDPEKIICAGHSEGRVIATALNEKVDLAGLMLLSGGVDNIEQALIHQRQNAYGELKSQPGLKGWVNNKLKIDKKGEKAAAKMLNKAINSNKDVIRYNFAKVNAKWFREHFAFNTRESLKKVAIPVFVIHGDKDALVNSDVLLELEHLVQGKSEYHIIQNMEHGLKEQTHEKSILKAKKLMNESIGKPLHSEAKEVMENWLNQFKTANQNKKILR
ncbi:alpha/beta hydrolase family protein [Bacillus taeanensis]|uniref:Alpha/beta hydrolase n=1 Tax=Bacillus taeanensis TaxID=273032 RepID=A0A366XPL6_9BACI|nr:alpha/beta hydrolase [Bacillus taeanensis]RBW67676.1 alpha/beta hydrolase [Bacillus taeanensis]